MRCRIDNEVLIVDAESVSETKELEKWRAAWHAEPKKELWFKCNYCSPVKTIVI